MEPIEATGDLATGALLARAIEPATGEPAQTMAAGRCLNCGATLTTRYCGDCGQSVLVHATLTSIGHDLLHGLFHFEGKIWRTIPDLLVRPGDLTRRYVAGERAKFVSPLALFLFSVFLMFAAFESVGIPFRPAVVVIHNGRQLSQAEISRTLREQQARLSALKTQLSTVPPESSDAKKLRAAMGDAREQISGLAIADRINRGAVDAGSLTRAPPVTGWSSLDQRIKAAAANPSLLAMKLQANAHKFSWALIPLSVPFLWLTFVRRPEYRIYDHAIFIIYALAAAMLLMTAIAILSALGVPTSWAPLLIALHQYRQLRGAYGLTKWGAFWRAIWLQASAVMVLSLFSIIMLASGLIE